MDWAKFWATGFGKILGDFFANASGHPAHDTKETCGTTTASRKARKISYLSKLKRFNTSI
jgi:hypothetical protein